MKISFNIWKRKTTIDVAVLADKNKSIMLQSLQEKQKDRVRNKQNYVTVVNESVSITFNLRSGVRFFFADGFFFFRPKKTPAKKKGTQKGSKSTKQHTLFERNIAFRAIL